MGETIGLRNVDPLHGGKVELLVDHPGEEAPRAAAVIRRGAQTNPFLGPDGWQQVEHPFALDEAYREGGTLVLRYGAALVDNALRDDDIVQISLPELDVADVVTWSGITRSVSVAASPPRGPAPPPRAPEIAFAGRDADGRPTFVVDGVTEAAALTATIRRDDPDAPFLGPEGWQGTAHRFTPEMGRDADGRTVLTLDPGPAARAAASGATVRVTVPELDLHTEMAWPVEAGPAGGPSGGRGYLFPALLAALVLLVAGGAAWWVLSGNDAPVAETEPEAPTAVTAAPEPEPEPGIDPGQAAYDRAVAAMAVGDCAAARSDMLAAVGADHGPALLAWAEAQDSVDFEPCLTETENDVSAVDHFARACEAGADGAPESLSTFVAALERRSAEGDSVAEEVLRLAVGPAQAACGL